MTAKRVILEMGAGNDLHGKDYTKAACRAVDDALHHSSLVMIRTLGVNKDDVLVDVTIGVAKPEEVDTEAVKAKLPVGQVTVNAVKGGLDLPDADTGDTLVMASAAIEVRLDLD
ncbi:MAG: Lin0512 family protein [Rhodospirillaceae bacterium]|nr:Lin0512 family protein [Rhodospirillaceae bacterium]MDD9925708.1 Lin0512 family protein [Rhodospirillaceae bacterium]